MQEEESSAVEIGNKGGNKNGDQEERRRRHRQAKSLPDLEMAVSEVLESNQEAFQKLVNAATEKDKFKLVVAIDEASECPELVRTIIHNRDAAADSVTDMFKQNLGEVDSKNIVVRFSVAGTGAFASTVGSKQENFKNLNPSFVMRHRELRNRFLDVLPEMLVLGGGGERKKLSDCIE